MKSFLLVGFSLLMLFDTLAQVCFKLTAIHAQPLEMTLRWSGRVFFNPWVYGAFLGYIGAFFTWMTLLKRLSIGTSFAVSHIEVVSVMLVSFWLFNESLTLSKIIGAVLILAGIIVLAMNESKEH